MVPINKKIINSRVRPFPSETVSLQPDDPPSTPSFSAPTADQTPPTPMSFKDKLMGEAKSPMDEPLPPDEIIIEADDFSVTLDGPIPAINFSPRVKALMVADMRYSVVVKLLGRFVRQATLYTKIESLWKPKGGFKLCELEGGCYLVHLNKEEDYQKALLGRPWVVFGHYFTVNPWEPELSPNHLEITQVYAWVRLPGLPFHYYHKHVLRTIGDLIGEVLKIDYNTAGGEKARFARLAVKVDLQRPLVYKLVLDGITQFVEYEGLPVICYQCGCYGHVDVTCPQRAPPSSAGPHVTPPVAPPTTAPSPVVDDRNLEARDSALFC